MERTGVGEGRLGVGEGRGCRGKARGLERGFVFREVPGLTADLPNENEGVVVYHADVSNTGSGEGYHVEVKTHNPRVSLEGEQCGVTPGASIGWKDLDPWRDIQTSSHAIPIWLELRHEHLGDLWVVFGSNFPVYKINPSNRKSSARYNYKTR